MSLRAAVLLATLVAAGCAGARAPPAPARLTTADPGLASPLAAAAPAPAAPLEGLVPTTAPEKPAAPASGHAAPAVQRERPRRWATGSAPSGEPGGVDATGVRARTVEAARALLGTRPRLDCSGYVLSALAAAGVTVALQPAGSRSESLYRASRLVARPRPGDLAFFHDTLDRDRNGRRGDRFTHVALVEAVDGSAITLLHRGGRRVERIRMDLSRPSDPSANDPVRVRRPRDPRGTRYLSGELFAAFGGLLPGDVTPKLQARRGRDTSARDPARR